MAEPYDGKKILVVDDDPDIITAITTAFAETGATLETATDGNTAVRLAEENKPDLVILDIMLPQKSGFLVLEKIRRGRAPGQKPHVVMITGNQGRRHQDYAKALGVAEYLHKPFALDRLLEISKELLARDE